jgi:hypothetical protein
VVGPDWARVLVVTVRACVPGLVAVAALAQGAVAARAPMVAAAATPAV